MRKANTASVTTKVHQATAFGATCRVFPINGTTYLYSESIEDFIKISREIRFKGYNALKAKYSAADLATAFSAEPLDAFLNQHKDEFFAFIKANVAELQEFYKMRTTTNINMLKRAKGEILLYGAPHFLAIKQV